MWNASYKKDADQYGYSLFASTCLTKNVNIYARYDDVFSKDEWNQDKDEAAAIVGAQFKLGKYVKLAPNVRLNMSKARGVEDVYSAYVSCYFGL